ncbi:MFS transporter [Streptomyces lunalinharesii]|uniref:MFS transporter n=1 Tax=Streptomyces lunalinharesii TaxID=333384 RepID=A0ABP6F8B7_9ACTN
MSALTPPTPAPGSPPAAAGPTGALPEQQPAPGGRPGVALLAALLGFLIITVDVSGVNIALPAIRSSLHGGMAGLQWVVDAYTLMFAALMLSAGAFADRAGARRAYALGVALFTVASLACALAPGIGTLIAARVVQGSAAAAVMPASLALIRQTYEDPGRRARAIALWSVGGSLAMAIGPVLGGALTETAGWRAVFLLNLPVGAVILGLLARVPVSARRRVPFDPAGQATAVLALAALAYAVIEGGHAGRLTWSCAVALGIALAAALGFRTAEARHPAPMVPLEMFRQREVVVTLSVGFAVNAAYYGTIFLLGLYYQQLRGMSGTAAGLMFVPTAAVITAVNLLSPRLADRYGRRPVIVWGQALLALAMAALLVLGPDTPAWLVLVLLLPFGISAVTVPALTALLMDRVPGHRAGTASGLLNAMRQTGGALAVALFGTLLAGPADGDFSVGGLHLSLALAAALLCATTLLARLLLPRD